MMKNIRVHLLLTVFAALFSTQLHAQVVFLVEEPQPLSGGYDFTFADTWAADMDTIAITAPAAFAVDATIQDSLACETIVNGNDVDGKIAVVYRGDCEFSTKALNVQDQGAVAVVIINNIPGSPVGMAGGVVAAQVTIPVVMISNTDGAALRDAILADEVVIYLGNNTGVFEYNVGTYGDKISRAKNTAIPTALIENAGDTVRMSAWTFNYGSEEATGVKFNAVLERDGNEIFNQTTDGVDIPALGDSALLTLPEQILTDPGYYTLTYNVFADSADQFTNDNEIVMNFWLNQAYYAKSRISDVDGPLSSGAVQPAADGSFSEWEWCTNMKVDEANGFYIEGVQFATSTGDSTIEIDGKSVFLRIYEWDGVDLDGVNELTANEIYDYIDNDDDNEFVTHTFAEPIELIDDQRYLTCLFIDDEDLFVAYDTETDYTLNFNSIFPNELISPLLNETWFGLGFGFDAVPAIITILGEPQSVSEEVENSGVEPYPNPTTDYINVPMRGLGAGGDIFVEVFDVAGSLVLSDNVCVKSSDMRLDVTDLSSGLHFFNLTFEDNSRTTFRVMITK